MHKYFLILVKILLTLCYMYMYIFLGHLLQVTYSDRILSVVVCRALTFHILDISESCGPIFTKLGKYDLSARPFIFVQIGGLDLLGPHKGAKMGKITSNFKNILL